MSNKNIPEFINSAVETNFSLNSSIIKYDSSLTTIFFKELLQELNIFLLNMDITKYCVNKLNEFTNSFLFEYDLDPKNVLIGHFYQHGIGCEIEEVKSLEIFSSF
ncbi:hypothetical protein C1645_823820 [Glomus cerebriforme]|uniref:Uncharacterized protein n=1 Tax=Glomus cerebriforme TaxID=658196 RepID=A0A397T4M4_9GLOM|nr:hypothetical protein C1645_823820 [Glomus cerebriforme]